MPTRKLKKHLSLFLTLLEAGMEENEALEIIGKTNFYLRNLKLKDKHFKKLYVEVIKKQGNDRSLISTEGKNKLLRSRSTEKKFPKLISALKRGHTITTALAFAEITREELEEYIGNSSTKRKKIISAQVNQIDIAFKIIEKNLKGKKITPHTLDISKWLISRYDTISMHKDKLGLMQMKIELERMKIEGNDASDDNIVGLINDFKNAAAKNTKPKSVDDEFEK